MNHKFYYGLLLVLLYLFLSNKMRFYPVAVASNSMNPSLKKGDVVIIDKESKYKKGDIIAYYYQNMLIIHRITYETNCNDDLCIYTKGDQNKKEDPFLIQKNRILGKVIRKIPMIGYPTILIYSTFE